MVVFHDLPALPYGWRWVDGCDEWEDNQSWDAVGPHAACVVYEHNKAEDEGEVPPAVRADVFTANGFSPEAP